MINAMHGIQKRRITDISDIDWNELIKIQRKRKPEKKKPGPVYWDKRAASFVDHVGKTAYPDAFLRIMEPEHDWTVIDMGCGGGTLALPLASKVKEITAVDFSDRMLGMLSAEIQRRDIKNIKTIKASWGDDWPEKGIDLYDIAIASRSLSVDDVEGAITKLINAATKRVYISTVVGDGPYDRHIYETVGRDLIPAVDYIYIYNLLYQMGIRANICFIPELTEKTFEDVTEARNYFGWMLHEMTIKEEYRLDLFIRKNMVVKNGRMVFEYKKSFEWAVIWWNREQK
jgi:SAM-dependent methyltransferase